MDAGMIDWDQIEEKDIQGRDILTRKLDYL